MKKNKTSRPDSIEIDIIKAAGEPLQAELANLYTRCVALQKVPTAWKEPEMALVFKKGEKRELKKYRPISLLSHTYKIFTKIISKRLEQKLDLNQPKEQAGFRKGNGTIDHIHVLNQLKEKCCNYNLPLFPTFVDYEKAFDSVETDDILKSVVEQGVDIEYVNILKDIYTNCSATTRLGNDSTKFIIAKRVRQGDIISPKLFTACLERVFKGIDWNQSGIAIDGESLNHLRFADDIVLISKFYSRQKKCCNNSMPIARSAVFTSTGKKRKLRSIPTSNQE